MICKHILLITFLYEPEVLFCSLLKGFKYCYLIQIIIFIINHLFAHIQWFQLLSCITNTSIKHQLFVNTLLNDQTVLFLTIKICLHCLNVKQFHLTNR